MAKKRRKLSKKQLSAAAKKGWKTRRAKALAKKAIRDTQYIEAAQQLSKPLRPKKKVVAEVERLKEEVQRLQRQLERKEVSLKESNDAATALINYLSKQKKEVEDRLKLEELFKTFVPIEDMSWIRADGTLAKNPSRLRHHEHAEVIWKELNKHKHDSAEFRMWAEMAAETYDVDVREVYDFYYSP